MRKLAIAPPLAALLCVLTLGVQGALCQTSSSSDSPYGGVAITPGAVAVGSAIPGALPPSGGSTCPSGDPCVLTGQYSRYRTSANPNETLLAGFNSASASSFGLASFYALTSTPPSGFTYEPVVAQPLYATRVPTAEGPKSLLIVGSLNDWVYAFDTSSPATPLWTYPTAAHCGSSGQAFPNQHSHNPGGANLDYYGIVATPVIDILPSTPVAFVVSACISSPTSTDIEWWLDAISASTGTSFASLQLTDGTNFNSAYQVARASLLLTHPTSTTTDVYIAFGTGVGELQAASSCGAGCAYSGVLFGYSVAYHSTLPYVTFSALSSSPFYTSCGTTGGCTTTGLFPSVYANFDTLGAPIGPSGYGMGGPWDQGYNWAVNGGGIWMSSKGPASTGSADVYVAAGNGPFACASTGSSECTAVGSVYYWGESAFKFPAASASNPMTPTDFYAPYVQRYTTNKVNGDPSPAPYQTEELSLMDLDFGSSGVVIIPHATTFAMTSDKSGYLYVMPAESTSLGRFRTGDSGLTGGTVITQPPFQVSRLPTPTNYTTVCPVNDDSTGTYSSLSCDEVHELAFWAANDLLFVWPIAESVEVFQGAYSSTSYSFGTSPAFDPCTTAGNCTGEAPPFPRSQPNSEGGVMALAVDSAGDGTLWGLVPRQNSATPPSYLWGWLDAYSISSDGTLTHIWDSVTGHNCTSPPATGWFTTSFTEPTLANGAAYVPAVCAVTDGNQYQTCAAAAAASAAASGILVFSTCP